jgi:hypothetical protein
MLGKQLFLMLAGAFCFLVGTLLILYFPKIGEFTDRIRGQKVKKRTSFPIFSLPANAFLLGIILQWVGYFIVGFNAK